MTTKKYKGIIAGLASALLLLNVALRAARRTTSRQRQFARGKSA